MLIVGEDLEGIGKSVFVRFADGLHTCRGYPVDSQKPAKGIERDNKKSSLDSKGLAYALISSPATGNKPAQSDPKYSGGGQSLPCLNRSPKHFVTTGRGHPRPTRQNS